MELKEKMSIFSPLLLYLEYIKYYLSWSNSEHLVEVNCIIGLTYYVTSDCNKADIH